MEVNTTPPPIAEGSVNVSAPAPQVGTPAIPQVATPTPVMANGGETSGGSFFKNINWVEIGFMVLGSAALIYTMHYYKVQLQKNKLFQTRTSKQIDELKMNLQSVMKNKYKEIV